MSSLLTPSKARTHMVNFRLTEDERASLARAAAAAGERSISDFVRKTMLAEASPRSQLESPVTWETLNMSESTREHIAHRIRSAREAAGLSQGQVAKLLGLHRPTISEIEAGRRRVSGEELVRFSETYGVSVEWLTSSSETADPSEDRILMAARELSKMKDQDLDKLLGLLRMLRKPKESK